VDRVRWQQGRPAEIVRHRDVNKEISMKKILVPLDGSDFGEFALPAALAFARAYDGRAHLVHVEEPAPLVPGRIEEPPAVEWADAYVEDVQRRLAEVDDVETVPRVLVGEVAEQLLRRAKQIDADLIVMTTHGRGRFSRFWLGSVADALLRQASCPLLVVRPDPEEPVDLSRTPTFGRVAVGLDGSENSERALAVASDVADRWDGALRLIQILEVPPIPFVPEGVVQPLAPDYDLEELTDLLDEAAEHTGVSVDYEVEARAGERVAEELLDAAGEWEADLLVVGTRGRGGAARMLLGSVADKVIRGSSGPVLVVPPEV